jgi:magnesium-transporting ATPase (P-type)
MTLDIIKLMYSNFIAWDIKMFDQNKVCRLAIFPSCTWVHHEHHCYIIFLSPICSFFAQNTPAVATNTAIAESLGQIDVILSDKTGTLTENLMIFRKCAVGDRLYGEHADIFEGLHGNFSVSARFKCGVFYHTLYSLFFAQQTHLCELRFLKVTPGLLRSFAHSFFVRLYCQPRRMMSMYFIRHIKQGARIQRLSLMCCLLSEILKKARKFPSLLLRHHLLLTIISTINLSAVLRMKKPLFPRLPN